MKNIFLDKPFLSAILPNNDIHSSLRGYNINMHKLYDDLILLRKNYMKCKTHMQVYESFRWFFRKNYPHIHVGRLFSQKQMLSSESCFNGVYDFTDRTIKIIYMVNPEKAHKSYEASERKFDYLRFEFVKILCHELVHVAQHIKNDLKSCPISDSINTEWITDKYDREEIEYLSDSMEIEALSHDAVIEFLGNQNGSSFTLMRYRMSFRRLFTHINNTKEEFLDYEDHKKYVNSFWAYFEKWSMFYE